MVLRVETRDVIRLALTWQRFRDFVPRLSHVLIFWLVSTASCGQVEGSSVDTNIITGSEKIHPSPRYGLRNLF